MAYASRARLGAMISHRVHCPTILPDSELSSAILAWHGAQLRRGESINAISGRPHPSHASRREIQPAGSGNLLQRGSPISRARTQQLGNLPPGGTVFGPRVLGACFPGEAEAIEHFESASLKSMLLDRLRQGRESRYQHPITGRRGPGVFHHVLLVPLLCWTEYRVMLRTPNAL